MIILITIMMMINHPRMDAAPWYYKSGPGQLCPGTNCPPQKVDSWARGPTDLEPVIIIMDEMMIRWSHY